MSETRIVPALNRDRRLLLGVAGASFALAQLGIISAAIAQAHKTTTPRLPNVKPGTHTSLGPLKQIDAGVLNIGYAEAGPAHGRVVVLLHGRPYDLRAFADVAPLLASPSYRVVVP